MHFQLALVTRDCDADRSYMVKNFQYRIGREPLQPMWSIVLVVCKKDRTVPFREHFPLLTILAGMVCQPAASNGSRCDDDHQASDGKTQPTTAPLAPPNKQHRGSEHRN